MKHQQEVTTLQEVKLAQEAIIQHEVKLQPEIQIPEVQFRLEKKMEQLLQQEVMLQQEKIAFLWNHQEILLQLEVKAQEIQQLLQEITTQREAKIIEMQHLHKEVILLQELVLHQEVMHLPKLVLRHAQVLHPIQVQEVLLQVETHQEEIPQEAEEVKNKIFKNKRLQRCGLFLCINNSKNTLLILSLQAD